MWKSCLEKHLARCLAQVTSSGGMSLVVDKDTAFILYCCQMPTEEIVYLKFREYLSNLTLNTERE